MKKLKIVNPFRFTIFCLCVIITITVVCCSHINKINTENFKRAEKISREIEKAQILSEEEQEALERFIQEEETEINKVSKTLEDIIVNTPKTQNLGVFTVTAYCCCKECCGKDSTHPAYGITKSGKRATEGRTIAVDPSVIPLGSTVYLNNIPYIAEDTGSAIKGKKIDLFINDHQRAKVFGVQEMEVKL